MWNKYAVLFKTYFISAIEYRWELILWALLTLLPLGLMFVIWSGIFKAHTSALGYQLPQIIQYYLLVAIIDEIVSVHFESWRVQQIREGKIDLFMTWPLSYLIDVYIADIANKCLYVILTFPLYAISIVIIAALGLLASFAMTPLVIFQFLLLLFSSMIVEFLVGLIIVILGFWFEGAEGLEHFKWVSMGLLSGWMIPIAFMPTLLKQLVAILPFRYMFAVPIGLIQHTESFRVGDALYQAGFIAVLLTIALCLWSKARKKYGSYGG